MPAPRCFVVPSLVAVLLGCGSPRRPLSHAAPEPDSELLAAVCGPTSESQDFGSLACAQCPAFTAAGRMGTGPARVTAMQRGHFSGPEADEVAVTLSGCEGHANDYAGTAVVERSDGHWRLSRYLAGRALPPCVAVELDGRTRLLCGTHHVSQGTEVDTLTVEDLGADGTSTLLARATDVSGALCVFPAEQRWTYRVATLIDFGWSDIDGDGAGDVAAHLAYSTGSLSPDPAWPDCEARVAADVQRLKSTHRIVPLAFLSKSGGFTATPATARILQDLR